MEKLHGVLSAIRTETKSKDHLSVFREFLAHLNEVQRQAPAKPRPKPPRKRAKRAR